MRTHQRSTAMRSALQPLVLVLGVVVIGAALSGCSKPLLSPADGRSQFDRYDAVRNQYASQYREDEFGRLRPNLRARLSPKD